MSNTKASAPQAPKERLEGTLTFSATRGRYAIRRGLAEREVVSGMRVEIDLCGQWMPGHIELRTRLYACSEGALPSIGGYYFISEGSGIAGLCAGMHMRVDES